jgi:hypothetical protein
MSEVGLPSPFIDALKALVDWLEAEQVPHATIGGVAVSLVAQPRATQVIDAVIWLAEDRWKPLLESSHTYGFEPRINDALEFAKRARVFLLKHQTSGVSIDLSCGALDFERETIERAVDIVVGALRLKVATPEDLITMKAVAHRPRDMADIESILDANPTLDLQRVRNWVSQFASVLEAPEILNDLEAILSQRHNL